MTGNEERATLQEVVEMIAELEQYRDRLVSETMEAAQRAKLMKSAVMAQLNPELERIEAMLAQLRTRQAALGGIVS